MDRDAYVCGQQFGTNKIVLPVQRAFHPVVYPAEQAHNHAVPRCYRAEFAENGAGPFQKVLLMRVIQIEYWVQRLDDRSYARERIAKTFALQDQRFFEDRYSTNIFL